MYLLFARRGNEAINKWLDENPLVLGGGAIVIGLVLLSLGIKAFRTGTATTKRGAELTGGQAKAMAMLWTGFGGLCLLFGLYKLAIGLATS
jgi:hypothetical protein